MKLTRIYSLFIFCIYSGSLLAQNNVQHYERDLNGVSAQWHSFILPNSSFSKLKPDFSDLRILRKTSDTSSIEIPYLINVLEQESSIEQLSFDLINQTVRNGDYYFTYEVSPQLEVSELKLELENQNFDWRVSVEGSQDQQEWFTIVKDNRILSIFNDDIEFEYSTISFSPVKFSYLRLKITADEVPLLSTSTVTRKVTSPGAYSSFKIRQQSVRQNKEHKTTEIQVWLDEPVPISNLKVQFSNTEDFYRPVSVSYLTDSLETEKGTRYLYRHLITSVFNSEKPKQLISFPPKITNGFKFIIRNYDNQPLILSSIEATGPQYEVLARFDGYDSYVLAYGNHSLVKPFYDLKYFRENIPNDIEQLASIGSEKIVYESKDSSIFLSVDLKLLLWALILISIAVLGWFSFKMMK